MKQFVFNFPPIKGLENFTEQEQIAHINTEIFELMEAFYAGDDFLENVEAMDVIHAVETLLRMRGIVGDIADMYRDECEHKNRVRGYYDEQ